MNPCLPSRVRIELLRITATFARCRGREPSVVETGWLERYAKASAAFSVASKGNDLVAIGRAHSRMITAAGKLGFVAQEASQ